MQSFAPDVECVDAESWYRSHVVTQEALLLFEGKSRDKVGGPFIKGIGRVQINRNFCFLRRGLKRRKSESAENCAGNSDEFVFHGRGDKSGCVICVFSVKPKRLMPLVAAGIDPIRLCLFSNR